MVKSLGLRVGGAKRAAFVDAVIEVMVDRGFEHTRLTDVATATGVAVGTLRNYFHSREDMLVEALVRVGELEAGAQEAVVAAYQDPWAQLVALVDRNLQALEQSKRALVEFWYAAVRDEKLRERNDEMRTRVRAPYLMAVITGRKQGV